MRYVRLFLLIILFVLSFYLRFKNLGYSDYIPDETTVLTPLKDNALSWHFFTSQRKGSMQWLVALVPFLITNDVFNTFIMRLPFALFNLASVYLFYKFVLEHTKNFYVSLLSAFFFSSASY